MPSCTCLAVVTVDVMRPQLGATSPAAFVKAMRPDGTAKFARLSRLKISIRAWIDRCAASGNDLISERSTLTRPGPVSVFRPRLPRVPAAGRANAVMSQYRSGPPRIGLSEKPGFRSGRSFIEKPVVFRFPDRLKPRRTVNGWPLWSVVTLLSCQPFKTCPARPVHEDRAGTSQLQLNVRLWRAWNAEGPRSNVGSYQSSPYCTTLS